MLTVINPGREWPQLCKALGHDEWLEDERFVDMRTLFRNRLALIEMIGAATGQLSLAELTATLDAHAVTHGVVNQMSEVVHDVQLRANEIIVATESDDETYPFTVASPISVAEEPKRSSGPAPQIGLVLLQSVYLVIDTPCFHGRRGCLSVMVFELITTVHDKTFSGCHLDERSEERSPSVRPS